MIFSGSFAFRKATRLVYHISFHLSRGFPKVFQLFSIFVRGLPDCCPSLFRGALVQCPHIIALLPPIVKGFFSTFFTLVLWALCHNFVAAELCMLHTQAAILGGFQKTQSPGKPSRFPHCHSKKTRLFTAHRSLLALLLHYIISRLRALSEKSVFLFLIKKRPLKRQSIRAALGEKLTFEQMCMCPHPARSPSTCRRSRSGRRQTSSPRR